MADDRETCPIDGSYLEQLVEISTPNRLAHVVSRAKLAVAPPRDDELELMIIRDDSAVPIDQLTAPSGLEPLPVPPPVERRGRDAMIGGLIGLALLAASWLAMGL